MKMNQQNFERLLKTLESRYALTMRIARGEDASVSVGYQQFGVDQIKHAIDYVRQNAITNAWLFRPGGNIAENMNGPQHLGFIEKFVEKSGITVQVMKHKRADINEEIFHKEFSGKSIIAVDKETVTTVRAWKNGKPLSRSDTQKQLKDVMGYLMLEGERTSKRMKANLSMREITGFFDRNLKVGVFDPRKLDYGETVGRLNAWQALMAEEGMSVMNPRTAEEIAKQLEQRALSIDDLHIRDRVLREAERMKRAANEGGIFNLRLEGFQGIDIQTKKKLNKMFGQIKGNVIIASRDAWDDLYGEGIDVVTSFANIKSETGVMPGRRQGRITLEAKHINKKVRMNIQAAIANPDLFAIDQLSDATNRELDKFFNMLHVEGKIPEGALRHFQDIVDGKREFSSVFEKHRQQAFARRAIDYARSGLDIREDPQMLQSIMANMREWLQNSKKPSDPNFFVPDAIGGYIFGHQHPLGYTASDVAQGQVRLVPGLGWAMNPADISKYHFAFGGSDLDDYVEFLIRWDDASDKLKAIGIRPPTARGEIGVFDIDVRDPAVVELIRERIGDDVFDMFEFNRLGLASNVEEWTEFVKGTIQHIDDAQAIVERSIATGSMQRGLSLKDMPTEEDMRNMVEAALEKKLKPFDASNIKEYSEADELKAFQVLKSMDLQLEDYANTRIVLEDFVRINQEAFENLMDTGVSVLGRQVDDKFFEIYSQEKVIDMIVNAASGGDDDISVVTGEMKRLMGGLMGQEGFVMDETLFKTRLFNDQELLRGLAEAADTREGASNVVDDYLIDSSDRRAYWSRLVEEFGHVLTETDRRKMQILSQHEYPEEIMFRQFTPSAQKDALRLATAYKLAKEKWDERSVRSTDDALRDIIQFGVEIDDEDFRSRTIANEVNKVFTEMFEEDGTMGMRAREALGAYIQEYGDDSELMRIFSGGMLDAKTTVMAWYKTGGGTIASLKDLDETVAKYRLETATRTITRDMLVEDSSYMDDLGIPGLVDEALQEGQSDGAKRLGQQADNIATAAATARGRFEDFSLESVKSLAGNVPSLKKASIVGAIAIAGSFMYQATKDRTPEDMQGPPLLPGGSPYETDYYRDELAPGLGNSYISPNMSGVTYRVHAQGNFDPEVLRNRLEGISGAYASGSIYNVPRTNGDIFSSINEVFS